MPTVTTASAEDEPGGGGRATLVRWLRPDGATVAADEPICELESDHASVDVPASTAGVLRHLARAGDTVGVGDEVARIDPAP